MGHENDEPSAFWSLLTRLVRVPKREIDEQEAKREDQQNRTKPEPAKPRQIVPHI